MMIAYSIACIKLGYGTSSTRDNHAHACEATFPLLWGLMHNMGDHTF
jgi:hypothetical protein